MPLVELKKHNRYDYVPLPERPQFSWPGGKRLAFCINNNIEVFSFLEGLGSDSATVTAPQTTRNYAWRDYGNRVGQWYLFDLLEEHGLPASHNINSMLIDECPQIAARIKARGDEFIGHGRTNAERQDVLPEPEERQLIDQATQRIQRFAGEQPVGWMGPYLAQTAVTLDLLKEAGYKYMLDWPADDQPFWMKTRAGRIMSVPYPIEINDTPTMLSRAQPATDFQRMILDQFEEMLRLSQKQSLVCGISMHTFCTGQPFRLAQVRQALQTLMKHPGFDKVWVTTPGGIAEYAAKLPTACVP